MEEGKIVGMGETILDIVIGPDGTPRSARPGGSVFNALVSVARSGRCAEFISEVGDDHVGRLIRTFACQEGIGDQSITVNSGAQSHIALAFLDKAGNAQYQFYKNYAAQHISYQMPTMGPADVLLYGSYFALNPALRDAVSAGIEAARKMGSMLYYDVNFRATHAHEAKSLWPVIADRMRAAHVVKGSDEDVHYMFGTTDWRSAYHEHIEPLCPYFICTEGADGATLLTPTAEYHVPSPKTQVVSTIGAGDTFNAGTLCGLLAQRTGALRPEDEDFAERLVRGMEQGVKWAAQVCGSLENYIPKGE